MSELDDDDSRHKAELRRTLSDLLQLLLNGVEWIALMNGAAGAGHTALSFDRDVPSFVDLVETEARSLLSSLADSHPVLAATPPRSSPTS